MDTVFGLSVDKHIQSTAALREMTPEPSENVRNKVIDHIDDLSQRFIAASALAIVSTARADRGLDISPRGDPHGFVHVLNENLLAFPDRPGNKRMDTFNNIFENQQVAILFIIPGHRDTLRVSGRAAVVQDADLADRLAVNGRPAGLVMLVKVERVLCHCSKAFIRGNVWQSDKWPDTSDVPTLAELVHAHAAAQMKIEDIATNIKNDAETNLY